MNKFKSLIPFPPLSTVATSDSSELREDAVLIGQFSMKWLLFPRLLPESLVPKFRLRVKLGSTWLEGDVNWRWRRVCPLHLPTEKSSSGMAEPRTPGNGWRDPPDSTVSTAAWQTCQFPVERRPTAPFTGFTVLPHASNSKLRNKAERTEKYKKKEIS